MHAQDAAELGGEARKKGKLVAMHKYLEHLKILADSNDPVIKKRFEDGLGNSADSLLFSVLHMYPHNKHLTNYFLYRGYEPPDLSLPRRQAMALLPPPPTSTTHHPNEHRPRPPLKSRPNR